MKQNIRICLVLFLTVLVSSAFNTKESIRFWGANGHRITAQIGDWHLNARAKKKVSGITDHPLAFLATFPDDVRSDPNWKFMSGLHFINVDDWETLESVLDKTRGSDFPTNVVEGIYFFRDILAGDASKKKIFEDSLAKHKAGRNGLNSTEEIALAYLVHFVGDVHQPMHAGRAYDRGGNEVAVNYFGSNTNLHSVWDSKIIESQSLSYTEYARFLNVADDSDIADWQRDSVEVWTAESVDLKSVIYPATYANTSGNPKLPVLSYDYNFAMKPTMDERLLKGGIRLAGLLNEIAQKK